MPEPELYSKNKLINPSAEAGSTAGWTTSGVSVVDGGTESSKCFRLDSTANMSQEVNAAGSQPPDVKVQADFLLEHEQPENDAEVYAWLKIEHEYADGSKDTFILPLRADVILGG